MKLNIGGTTKEIEMKTPTHFVSALKSPLLTAKVVTSVTNTTEHAALLKLLNTTTRPYAIAVLTVKP